jgi:hypothetical protein
MFPEVTRGRIKPAPHTGDIELPFGGSPSGRTANAAPVSR